MRKVGLRASVEGKKWGQRPKGRVEDVQSPAKGQSGVTEQNGGRQLRMGVVGCRGEQTLKGWTEKGGVFHIRLKH